MLVKFVLAAERGFVWAGQQPSAQVANTFLVRLLALQEIK